MKRLLAFLLVATLIMSGCTHQRPAAESEPTIPPESTEAMVSTAVTETGVPTESFSQPVTEVTVTTEAADIQYGRTSAEEKYRNTEPVEKETEPPDTRPKREETKETEPRLQRSLPRKQKTPPRQNLRPKQLLLLRKKQPFLLSR